MRVKTDPALWARIEAISLDVPGAELPFSARLARENGWTVAFAEQAVHEYKRFAYLCRIATSDLTPSDEVDQAWHLHLLYTRHYWGPWTAVLGAPLHHGPTEGGRAEGVRFGGQYARTLALYENEFGECPPEDLWPPEAVRFSRPLSARRVHLDEHMLVPRPGVLTRTAAMLLAAGVFLVPAAGIAHDGMASAGEHPGGWLVGFVAHAFDAHLAETLVFSVSGLGLAALVGFTGRRNAKQGGTGCGTGGSGCGGGSSGDGGSGCGGCGGCGG